MKNVVDETELTEKNLRITVQEDIKSMIYEVRGKQVILDSDVAMLYDYETKYIKRTVNRNQNRFPEGFCFQLSREEYLNLEKNNEISSRCQFGTLNKTSKRGSNLKYLPYVFTEQGKLCR